MILVNKNKQIIGKFKETEVQNWGRLERDLSRTNMIKKLVVNGFCVNL